MNIAVDNQVAEVAVDYLREKGFNVVYCAGSEMDHVWFREALDEGAEVFVSPDWDISFLCNQFDTKFIKLKQGLKGINIGRFVEDRLKHKRFD